MSKSRTYYSEEDKLALLREYHESGLGKYAFARQHGLCNVALLCKWLKKYEPAEKCVPLQSEPSDNDMANRSKDDYREENKELRKRIKDLEKSLEFSKLETKARDMMIDKAEEYFNIQIRKKSGAK